MKNPLYYTDDEEEGDEAFQKPMVDFRMMNSQRQRLTRPMSKRELFESIINFKTTVDDTNLDEYSREEEAMQPPPVVMPKVQSISTVR